MDRGGWQPARGSVTMNGQGRVGVTQISRMRTMQMASKFNRREFAQSALSAAVATGAMASTSRAGRIVGANDRVRLGCIGVGYRGVQVLDAFDAHKDAEIVALCDVYEPYLNGEFDKVDTDLRNLTTQIPIICRPGKEPERHKDFRRCSTARTSTR